jgi:uncharacterized protein involved in exopolysaccharide biosynthesis
MMPFDIKFYLSIFWRRFPYFAIVAALIGAIGVSVASVLPTEYRATAVLLIEQEQIPTDMIESTVRTTVNQQVNIIRERLTSRSSLIDNAAQLGLYREGAGMDPNQIVEDMRRRLSISQAQTQGRTRGSSPDGRVAVSFQFGDPQVAAQVANHFAAIIEREAIAMRRGVAGTTLDFFREEVNRLNREMGIHRARVLDFRMQNRDRLPESLEYRRNRMAFLQAEIARSEAEEAALIARRDDLMALFQARGRISEEVTPLELELARAQEERDRALRLYSPQNPRVRVIQVRVQELEQAVRTDQESRADDFGSEFERRIAEIGQEIARQADVRAEARAEISELQQTIDETTLTSVRLQEMEQELSYVRSQHDQVARQLARAEMGERIELLARGQRIAILEQAWPPASPYSPNRPQIALAGVGGGIAAGLALVVLLEFLNRSIRRPVEITKRLGITPIATMPLFRTRRQILIRRAIIAGALALALIGVPLTLWGLHSFYLPLDLLIERFLEWTGLAVVFDAFR